MFATQHQQAQPNQAHTAANGPGAGGPDHAAAMAMAMGIGGPSGAAPNGVAFGAAIPSQPGFSLSLPNRMSPAGAPPPASASAPAGPAPVTNGIGPSDGAPQAGPSNPLAGAPGIGPGPRLPPVPGVDPHVLSQAFHKIRTHQHGSLLPNEMAAFQQARTYFTALKAQQQQQQTSQPQASTSAPAEASTSAAASASTSTLAHNVNGHVSDPSQPRPSPSPVTTLSAPSAPTQPSHPLPPPRDLLPRSRWFTKESTSPSVKIGPALTPLEQRRLKEWVGRDEAYERAMAHEKAVSVPNKVGRVVKEEILKPGDWLGAWTAGPGAVKGGPGGAKREDERRMGMGLSFKMPDQREREILRGKRNDRPLGLGLNEPPAALPAHLQQPQHAHHPRHQVNGLSHPASAAGAAGTGRKRLSKRKAKELAEAEEMLVPVRLDIEHEHWRLRDTFTWNLHETVITPDQFARNLCRDLILPVDHFSKLITGQIREQLDDYRLHENFEGHLATAWSSQEAKERAETEDLWWEVWRSGKGFGRKEAEEDEGMEVEGSVNGVAEPEVNGLKRTTQNGEDKEAKRPKLVNGTSTNSLDTDDDRKDAIAAIAAERAQPVDDFLPSLELRDDELRITIFLDILLGRVQLTDRFDWEVSESNNSPEQFAEVYASDLGLSGEFKTAIAHSIREQVEVYVKSLSLVEHQAGFLVPNDELRFSFLGPVTDPYRGSSDEHTPILASLSPEELDKQEKEHEREVRRKRRQTRGRRGVALPDRGPQRTARTIVPRQGVPMAQPFQDENDETVLPPQPIALPYRIEELQPVVQVQAANAAGRPGGLAPDTIIIGPGGKRISELKDSAAASVAGDSPPTPMRGGRLSRRFRGQTVDVSADNTPGPEDGPADDAPTPAASVSLPAGGRKGARGRAKGRQLDRNVDDEEEQVPAKPKEPPAFDWAKFGLHDIMIDGVWHCSNCGCPDDIAIGRRKGPGGNNTLCGECGKYMHRYKKNRPTHYTTDRDYHLNLKAEAQAVKEAVAGEEAARRGTGARKAEPASKKRETKAKAVVAVQKEEPELPGREDRDTSVLSSLKGSSSRESSAAPPTRPTSRSRKRLRSDSLSDPPSDSRETSAGPSSKPLRVQVAGNARRRSSSASSSSLSPAAPLASLPTASAEASMRRSTTTDSKGATRSTPAGPKPPQWMLDQIAALRDEYKDDKVELLQKPRKDDVPTDAPVEWRLRCLDCPGKVYTTGPGETFSNFIIHLKNRGHRAKVDERVKRSGR